MPFGSRGRRGGRLSELTPFGRYKHCAGDRRPPFGVVSKGLWVGQTSSASMQHNPHTIILHDFDWSASLRTTLDSQSLVGPGRKDMLCIMTGISSFTITANTKKGAKECYWQNFESWYAS